MALLDVFCVLSHRECLVAELAEEVAERCRLSLLQRVCEPTRDMSEPQIKGYLRAHAAHRVPAETPAVLNWYGYGDEILLRVSEQATELLVAMLLTDLHRIRVEEQLAAAAA